MHALFAGLTTLDVVHALDHVPDPTIKVTSVNHMMAAGGPATNAAITVAVLHQIAVGRPAEADVSPVGLLTALGAGASAHFLARDLGECGVDVLDATTDGAASEPAVSSIIEHPQGRMVASTNARVEVDDALATRLLEQRLASAEAPDVVMIDGHNPSLAEKALRIGVPTAVPTTGCGSAPSVPEQGDPFAELEAKPPHLRVLDGGSWKPWLTPLLGLVDVAVVSADFCPPLLARPESEAVAEFLRGFGIARVVRTRGENAVQWWWDDQSGTVEVPQVNARSTMGAGDIFHGAFCWALASLPDRGLTLTDPTEVIAFASQVAAISTTSFGTRQWRENSTIDEAVAAWLARLP